MIVAARQLGGSDSDFSAMSFSMRRNSTLPREPVSDRYRFHGGDWFSQHLPVWENALADYGKKPGIQYLEVGVFEGRSAIWMIDNILTHSSSQASVY